MSEAQFYFVEARDPYGSVASSGTVPAEKLGRAKRLFLDEGWTVTVIAVTKQVSSLEEAEQFKFVEQPEVEQQTRELIGLYKPPVNATDEELSDFARAAYENIMKKLKASGTNPSLTNDREQE